MTNANINAQERLLVMNEVNMHKKSAGIAWLLWLFTGGVAGHRFYMGRPGHAFLLIGLNLITFGVAALVDAFFINGRIRDYNERIEREATAKYSGATN